MTVKSLRGRPTRAEARAIEQRLRGAAVEAFTDNGFDGTTMEAVAAAAGITKRTLYSKYADKGALFAAVMPQALADMGFRDLRVDAPESDLPAALRELSRQVVERLVAPRSVRLRRLAVLESNRIAQLDQVEGADLWSTSLRPIVDLLAAGTASGQITVGDLGAAADLFLAMVAARPTMLADLGVPLTATERDGHIARAVELFLVGILPRC